MGVNLKIEKDNVSAVLGREHRYKDTPGTYQDEDKLITEIISLVAYTPKSLHGLQETTDHVEYLLEELRKIGRKDVIADLQEVGFKIGQG